MLKGTKQHISEHWPSAYARAQGARDQLRAEVKVARQAGARLIAHRVLRRRGAWEDALPLQQELRLALPTGDVPDATSLRVLLNEHRIDFEEGAYTLYIPPAGLKAPVFASIRDRYPPNAGVKVLKVPGLATHTGYLDADLRIRVQQYLVDTHVRLMLAANALYINDLGPRLYDLVELQLGETPWTAYVVEHIAGGAPAPEQWADGVGRLRELDGGKVLRVVAPGGFEHPDFRSPDCNGNAKVRPEGSFAYVDFQNFALFDYGAYLRDLARDAVRVSHFGDRSLLRGGDYLYQSIPGVNMPSKRRMGERGAVLRALVAEAGISVQDRLVLDVGCNLGLMMGQYLNMGALWSHGWDFPHVVEHAERILLGVGCTRFSLTGAELSPSRRLRGNLPGFLAPHLDGCVISYLAVRRHVGWMEELRDLRWSAVVYEGHEGETGATFDRHMEELSAMRPARVAASTTFRDGDSDERCLAVIVPDGE